MNSAAVYRIYACIVDFVGLVYLAFTRAHPAAARYCRYLSMASTWPGLSTSCGAMKMEKKVPSARIMSRRANQSVGALYGSSQKSWYCAQGLDQHLTSSSELVGPICSHLFHEGKLMY